MKQRIDTGKLRRIFRYVRPGRPFYAFILGLDCVIETSLVQLVPIIIKIMVDAAVGADLQAIRSGLTLAVSVWLSGMGLFAFSQFYLFRSFFLTTEHIRNLMFRSILGLPVGYIERHHSGDTLSRLTNDVDTMENAYSWELRMTIVNLANGAISAVLMFLLDWRLSVVLMAVSSLSVLLNVRQKETLRKYNDEIQARMGSYTENLSNIVGGFLTVKSYTMERPMLDRTEQINAGIYESGIGLTRKSSWIEGRNYLFGTINFIGVIIFGSYLAMNGIGSLGSVAAIVILLGRVNRFFGQINDMIVQMQRYLSGADRVFELLDTPSERASRGDRADRDGAFADGVSAAGSRAAIHAAAKTPAAVSLQDVGFSYDGVNDALRGVSLTVERGRTAALVGPSGGGKSTIIKLILGFYPPASGTVTVDGRALCELSLEELRSQIAYVPQDAYVFDGTIRENIGYGRPGAEFDEIAAAARAANAEEFILSLPDGYETTVGERGVKLSGGQRQRVAVARAFLKNAPILLLDEATSSLDSKSERQVQDAISTLMKGKSTLVIAHRLSTVEHADVIYLVDGGRVTERGTHEELLAEGGMYRTLYERQFT